MGIEITIDDELNEESVGFVTVAFTTRKGVAVIPDSIAWTLSTKDGATIINEREQVAVAVPAASVEITISGDDLSLFATEQTFRDVRRLLTIEAVYDSDLGDDLPLRGDKIITVRNLKYIT